MVWASRTEILLFSRLQKWCYSRMVKGIIIHLMEVFPFRLSKVGRGEEMDIPGEGFRLPRVKKIGSSNQDQTGNLRSFQPHGRRARREGIGWQCGSTWKGKKHKGEDTLTLAPRIRLNQERGRAANCEQRRLIFELSCDKETIPAKLISDVALVHKILQEKLVVETNWQRSTITTIFATDPSNPWSWSVMFDSTATKQI